MGPELYFLTWHGLRVLIGKTNGGDWPKYLYRTYFVEECSVSEACMALFLGPAGQGFEGISQTGQESA
jgi:hypothetical protein